mgnify:FL=1
MHLRFLPGITFHLSQGIILGSLSGIQFSKSYHAYRQGEALVHQKEVNKRRRRSNDNQVV